MNKLFFLLPLSLLLVEPVYSASEAQCWVSISEESGRTVKVISTPNLQVYRSFATQTCSFTSADKKLTLGTGVLVGGIYANLRYKGKKLSTLIAGAVHNSFVTVEGSAVLPTGEEIITKCSFKVDLSDVHDFIDCQ